MQSSPSLFPRNSLKKLDEIEARHLAATQGPWEFDGTDIDATEPGFWDSVMASEVRCGSYCYGGSISTTISPENQELIENAQLDIDTLLGFVNHLRAVIEITDATAGSYVTTQHFRDIMEIWFE